jgi:hypothetical protein
MNVSVYTVYQFLISQFLLFCKYWSSFFDRCLKQIKGISIDLFFPFRQWLRNIQINDPKFAVFLCQIIPSNCPFERNVKVFGKIWFHIPPMCKLNPLYNELMELRFRSLCYLADEWEQDYDIICKK